MAFSTYEELMAAVEARRADILTLEIDLGGVFSPEHEEAKVALAQAKAMQTVFQGIGGTNLDELEQRVADTKPEPRAIWVQFEKIEINEWAALMKQAMGNPLDQYERIFPKVFIGVFGEDPAPEEPGPDWVKPEPLTTDPLSVSSKGGAKTILPGGSLNSVVQNFINWQNSGGDVTIRPTKSGRA